MSDSQRLLEIIEQGVVGHGGDLGGWTRRDEETLQLFDGRVTLRADVQSSNQTGGAHAAHVHILATLHEFDDEVLDACVMGIGDSGETAFRQAAGIWINAVAGPIRSLLDDQPACNTCRVGVPGGEVSRGYHPFDFGLPGLRAFVGPDFVRGFNDAQAAPSTDDWAWFRFAAESAAPRRIHLAKVTIQFMQPDGWQRVLEIDGHDVSLLDRDWPAAAPDCDFGYMIRFAVFESPRDSTVLAQRAELDRTIRFFAENFSKHASIDELTHAMVDAGFDQNLVDESAFFATMAFGRAFFEPRGVLYPAHVIRARRDGRIETNVPLMSIPAYSRCRALAEKLRESMAEQDFLKLCFYHAESNAICQLMEARGENMDMTGIEVLPSVVPDRGVSGATMKAALAMLESMLSKLSPSPKKPWWKFWR